MRHPLLSHPWLILLAVVAGCSDHNRDQSASAPSHHKSADNRTNGKGDPAQTPADSNDTAQASKRSGQALPDPVRGSVTETLEAGGYTYVRLATDYGDVWAAARKFDVAVGDKVEVAGMSLMRDFHSPTLKKTFKEIQFAGRARLVGDAAAAADPTPKTRTATPGDLPPGHPPLDQSSTSGKPDATNQPVAGKIEPLPDGISIAMLFDKKTDLAGKKVKLRGRVVKANRGILGRNWLHIKDGTGAPGSDDITVTSPTGFAAPGTIIVVEGTVALARDFGSGYTYDVIVEQATITPNSP